MKRTALLLSITLITTLVVLAAPSAGRADVIRLASGEWPPYQSEKLKYAGVASRIVTEAFALEGVEVHYRYFPWSRALRNAATGEMDGTFLWFDSAERRKTFLISDPVIDIQYVFFHLKNKPLSWNSISDLENLSIGATLKYTYGEQFDTAEKEKRINVDRVASDELNFKKLVKGRVDIFPCDLDAGLELISKLFTPEEAENLTWHQKPVRAAPHHLLLSRKAADSEKLMMLFNKGLKTLKESGKVQQYLDESRRGEYKQ